MIGTIPRYPEKHNSLLSFDIVKKLDAMTPADFKSYVLNELTLEERESLMVDERQRRRTFLSHWRHTGPLRPARMAQCGFYSIDNQDGVQCAFCRGILRRWELGIDPLEEHARSFTFCRFARGLSTDNIEFITRYDAINTEDTKYLNIYLNCSDPTTGDSLNMVMLGINTDRAAKVEYAPEASRLQTYGRFPQDSPVSGHLLGQAGFYYTGFDDNVRCFYCDGAVRGWREEHDPWVEHARWFPDCGFLILQKGKEFIEKVHEETPDHMKTVRRTEMHENRKTSKSWSAQRAMVRILENLGFDVPLVERVIKSSKKPIDNISQVIDILYAIRDRLPLDGLISDDIVHIDESDSILSTRSNTESEEMETEDSPPSSFKDHNGTDYPNCKMCKKKLGSHVKATRIGLPCGHVIYCESCDQIEKNKLETNSSYRSVCPVGECNTLLTGTLKFFLG